MNPFHQRAALAASRIIDAGGRVLISSRAFWARYDFPALETRREILDAAKAISAVSNELEAEQSSGTIADLYTQQGFPTTDLGGGPLATNQAHVHVKIPLESNTGKTVVRSWGIDVPWDTPIHAIMEMIGAAAMAFAEQYGLEELDEPEYDILLY